MVKSCLLGGTAVVVVVVVVVVLNLLEDGGLKTFLTLTLGLLISDESKGLGLTGETSLMIALPLDLVLPPFFGEDRISGRAVGKDCTVTGMVTNTVDFSPLFSTTNSILELNYPTHDCVLVSTRICITFAFRDQ